MLTLSSFELRPLSHDQLLLGTSKRPACDFHFYRLSFLGRLSPVSEVLHAPSRVYARWLTLLLVDDASLFICVLKPHPSATLSL